VGRPKKDTLPPPVRQTKDSPEVEVAWAPFAGPQSEALARQEDEIFYGGARGGGKTAVQIAWMGRMAVEKDGDSRTKYPGYRGLLVRYQQSDLKDWTDKAKQLYSKFGAVAKDDPAEFHFPGGPIIYTGYLKGEAWTKYQGWNIHKFGVDEAGQVPDIRFMGDVAWPVELVMASVRGSPDGINQSFLTGNPGNINDRRVKQRYTRVKDLKGRIIPPKTQIVDPTSGKTRVFIPAVVYDNEWILKNDPGYIQRLEAMPEQVRKAWIFGDWDAFEGSFFPGWRPMGPQSSSEPSWARHVLPAAGYKMAPWWWRWASLDWGFGHYSAAYKFVQNPNGQVVMSDELVRQKTGSVQLGVDIAKWMIPDLSGMPEGNMLLYISPDAIDQKRDATHTIAEKISMGMQSVLGKGGAWIAEMSEDEKELRKKDPVAALEALRRRQKDEQAPFSITIVRANNNRVDGWNHMRDLMRFDPIERAKPDEQYIQALLKANHADALIQQYLAQFNDKEEVLPQFVVLDRCKYFIEWVPTALHNPARVEDVLKTEGDDFGDAARYGLMAHRDNLGAMPKAQYVADRIAAVESSMISRGYSLEDPTMRAHALMKIEHDFAAGEDDGRMESFNLSRGGIGSPFGNRRLM
jgi:hypothetical protein